MYKIWAVDYMTQKGYMSDFYKQFEEVNKKLDKANNTILNMSLTISELNENNKNLLKELEETILKLVTILSKYFLCIT